LRVLAQNYPDTPGDFYFPHAVRWLLCLELQMFSVLMQNNL
jgi:hypothetical protein